MTNSPHSDDVLLKNWLSTRSDAAFRELVVRYAGLVHMAAMRTCGNGSIAAEASQNTFIALAQKADSLSSRKSLAGWLHLTAVMQAKNLERKHQRESRKIQNFRHQMVNPTPEQAAMDWSRLSPLLDEALSNLPAKDREALLLRFYRSLSIREVAENLGIAHAAAQKRVDRATERLRQLFERRGVRLSGSIGAVMAAGFNADAQAALPLINSLTQQVLTASAAASAATLSTPGIIALKKTKVDFIAASAVSATTTTLLMTKTTTTAITAAILLAGGGSLYLIHQSNQKATARVELLQSQKDAAPEVLIATNTASTEGLPPSSSSGISSNSSAAEIYAEMLRLIKIKFEGTADFKNLYAILESMDAQKRNELAEQLEALPSRDVHLLFRVMMPPAQATHMLARSLTQTTGFNADTSRTLAHKFGIWMRKDRAAADEWYDAAMASGELIPKGIPSKGAEEWLPVRALARARFSTLLQCYPEQAAAMVKSMNPIDAAQELSQCGKPQQVADIVALLPPAQQYAAARYTSSRLGTDFKQEAGWLNALEVAESVRGNLLAYAAYSAHRVGKLSRAEALEVINGLPETPEREEARRGVEGK